MKRMPVSLERAILEKRQYMRERDAQMRAKSGGKMGLRTRPDKLDKELRFWEIQDDEELDDFLGHDLLSVLGALDLDSLPKGYRPLIEVLEFERHCQFEGLWTSMQNREEEMPSIIESYKFVGLGDEAAALSSAFKAFERLNDGEHEDTYEKEFDKAYGSVPNRTPDASDRFPVILAFVRGHPDYFATDVA